MRLGTIQVLTAGSTGYVDGVLKDAADQPIALSRVNSAKLHLTDDLTNTFVNTRAPSGAKEDIKNANEVAIAATGGGIAWEQTLEDLAVSDPLVDVFERTALFTIDYDSNPARRIVQEHKIVICQRPQICTVGDVQALTGPIVDDDAEATIQLMILALTDHFEREYHRKILAVTDELNPARQVVTYDPTTMAGIQLERWPIASVVSVKLSERGDFASETALSPDEFYPHFPEEKGSGGGILMPRARGFGRCGPTQAEIRYTGGLAKATGALPRDLRQAAAEQISADIKRAGDFGLLAKSTAGQFGGSITVEKRDSKKLLSRVEAVFESYGIA